MSTPTWAAAAIELPLASGTQSTVSSARGGDVEGFAAGDLPLPCAGIVSGAADGCEMSGAELLEVADTLDWEIVEALLTENET